MIQIKNLTYKYSTWVNDIESKVSALDGVSLDIPSNCFMVILGPNGSGKSTLARHLNALLKGESGSILIDGKNVNDKTKILEIREAVGMVFQNPDNQIVGTTVEEDVAFGPENKMLNSKEIQEIVRDSIEKVGLSNKMKAPIYNLSGGEKQKVAIASILSSKPKYFILDEPTAMLDPESKEMVLKTLHKLNKDLGISIILITHHMDEALDADIIVVMNNGKILMKGSPIEVFSNPEVLEKSKLEIPPIVELGSILKSNGINVSVPSIDEEKLIRELKEIYNSKETH